MADEPEVITTIKARAGVTPHVVRYVLMISMMLAVAAMAWVYFDTSVPNQQETTAATSPH
jgi:hypothetical protein